jgi:hypothetical protein
MVCGGSLETEPGRFIPRPVVFFQLNLMALEDSTSAFTSFGVPGRSPQDATALGAENIMHNKKVDPARPAAPPDRFTGLAIIATPQLADLSAR